MAVLFGCGLRRTEAATLTMDSFVWQENALRFVGKGNKERLVPMPQRVMEILQLWLDERTGDPGPFFTRYRGRIPKGARITGPVWIRKVVCRGFPPIPSTTLLPGAFCKQASLMPHRTICEEALLRIFSSRKPTYMSSRT